MILYSIVPSELVFGGNNYWEGAKLCEAYYKGERIIVSHMSDNRYEVRKLLSTNPKSFLDPSFQPGSAVDISMLKMINNLDMQ